MPLTLREANREDAWLIADLSRQTFYDTFAAANRAEDMEKFLREQFTRGRLMLEVGAPGNTFLIAYLDEAVVGYVKLRASRPPAALGSSSALEIARLYAVKEAIGKGVGAALMQASLQRAEAAGMEKVWLGVWEKNERAIAFYERWGFRPFGETDFLLGDDLQRDWLLQRDVLLKDVDHSSTG
jgi:ribosomal protein S18 acetylase RimI-like enzyme